ncbi:MAG: hypothetical protein HKN16_12720 [Saprospiraceae bacterium]|nr:hypothetical protein [Saprospiraceae bacterium]
MALIGKIRNNSWLLVVLIGLGLGGFILMDMTSGQQSIFGSRSTSMGTVAGRSIDYNDFARTENALYGGSSSDVFSRRQALWNYYVEDALVKDEAANLGLAVTQEEFNELQFGANPSPVVQGAFRNPATGQLDRQQLQQIQQAVETNQLNPQFREYWAAIQKQIVKDKLESKINTLVSKSLYIPTWMVEDFHTEQNEKVNFNYVRIPYDEVDDSEVNPTDADFSAFLNDNKGQYYQDEETRKAAYVVFNAQATAEDSSAIRTRLGDLVEDFENTEEDSLFVTTKLGQWNDVFIKQDELGENIKDVAFDSPVGSVYGPYLDGPEYKVVKILDRKVIPDSVSSQHILLKYNDAAGYARTQNTADSLIQVITAGTTPFDTIAKRFSQDFSNASNGGDLGFVGQGAFVKPFNDLVFYQAAKGQLRKVDTQFGTHIVKVNDYKYTDRKPGVQLAYLVEAIIPSQETQRALYAKVLEFSGKNTTMEALEAAAAEEDLEVVVSPPVMRNDYTVGLLGGGQPSRDLITFLFNADPGQISSPVFSYNDPVFNYTNKYVVAGCHSIIPIGMPPVEAVRDDIRVQVANRAKAEILMGRIQGSDMASIAAANNAQVDSVSAAAFSAGLLPGLGNEPEVIATAFNTEIGQVSAPIIGNSGVYVVSTTAKNPAPSGPSIPALRSQMAIQTQSQVGVRLMESVRKAAGVTDNRATFF